MPSFCGAFLRCRPARHRSGARGLMDALVAAWLDVMPDAFRPPVRDATQRGHAGLRRATLRYNGLVPAELAERTQPLTPVVSGTLCRLDHSHGRRPGLHPQARQAESPGAPGLSEYRHGDSKPRHGQAVEPSLALTREACVAVDRSRPLGGGPGYRRFTDSLSRPTLRRAARPASRAPSPRSRPPWSAAGARPPSS
jgi:hypothetical protein